MTTISASAVAALRARTGVGILDAKNALEEANGNEDTAIELLRKRGKAQAVKKSDRAQSEGAIFIASTDKKSAVVQIKCETDFVARSDRFISLGDALAQTLLEKGKTAFDAFAGEKIPSAVLELGENISLGDVQEVSASTIGSYVHSNRKIGVIVGLEGGTKDQACDVAMHGAAMNPSFVRPSEVTESAVAKEKEIWKEQMKDEKKPAEILEKIMLGKEKKFREENALLTQSFVKNPEQTVEKMLGSAKVTAYVRIGF